MRLSWGGARSEGEYNFLNSSKDHKCSAMNFKVVKLQDINSTLEINGISWDLYSGRVSRY